MDSLSNETLAHIFTFISFHEITLNNMLYTCFRYQSVFKYLLQYTKIRAWFIYNHYHISTKKAVFFTPSDCEIFLFKPNVSTSITTRLFNVSTKNKISNYSLSSLKLKRKISHPNNKEKNIVSNLMKSES